MKMAKQYLWVITKEKNWFCIFIRRTIRQPALLKHVTYAITINGFKSRIRNPGSKPRLGKKHTNFISKHELPFSLLVDEDLSIIKAYGVWGEKTTFGKTYDGVLRTTFVIDEKGVIEKIINKVESKAHTEQIL
jgi:hypothetical protein